MSSNASHGWLTAAINVVSAIDTTQGDKIRAAAKIAARSIAAGGVVHTFGSGHSRIPVEELFPRYGSYPGWHPIVELSMTFHTEVAGSNGQRQAMFIERVPGLAHIILENFNLRSRDSLLVFSAGGKNAVPVEMAMEARRRGLKVIAVTSLTGSSEAGATNLLANNSDVVIDLCTPVGDAATAIVGWENKVGPLSTVANVVIANMIKVATAEALGHEGIELPVLTSAAVVGTERSHTLFEAAYLDHARRKAEVLRKQ